MATSDHAQTSEDVRSEVLKVVVLKQMATITAVAEASGIALKEVETVAGELERSGEIGFAAGYLMPTEVGQERVRTDAAARYGSLRQDPAVERWVVRFEPTNRRFLDTVSAWQTVSLADGQVPNDHKDPDYDARILSRLDELVTRMSKLLDELSDRVPRMARYRARLEAALERVEHGDLRYLSAPEVDSVHTVWFEMHESILIVLGRERTE